MKQVHVAVGVLTDSEANILIAKRPQTAHQGGLWEFPGGKVEPGETVQQALARELYEELDVHCDKFQPVIQIAHDYGDKRVLLDVHRVLNVSGMPIGKEGQPLRWVTAAELNQYPFPAANYPIVNALQLPERLLITGPFNSEADFLARIDNALAKGLRLIQLRAPQLSPEVLKPLAQKVKARCAEYGAKLVINADIALAAECEVSGVHLNSERLHELAERPASVSGCLVGGSCHNARDIAQANHLGLDYLVLSPVQATSSHPDASPMGWDTFVELSAKAKMPVYALGGMTDRDINRAQLAGGQGIAAISAWWGGEDPASDG